MEKKRKDWLYRFHDEEPKFIIPLDELSKPTQKNLEWLTDYLGIKFDLYAKAWPMPGKTSHINIRDKNKIKASDKIISSQCEVITNYEDNTTQVTNEQYTVRRTYASRKDILISGTFIDSPIEYWRHETKSPDAVGSTLIYLNNRRYQVSSFTFEWPTNLRIKSETVETTLAILLASDVPFVRNFVKTFLGQRNLNEI